MEEGKKEEEEKEEGKERKMENLVITEIKADVPKEADAVGGGVTWNIVSVARSTNAEDGELNGKRIRAEVEAKMGLFSSSGYF